MISNQERNPILDYMKAIAIILVVIGHSFTYYVNSLSNQPSRTLSIIMNLIYCTHTPLFFVVAGFLCHRQQLLQFYQKKLRRIFLPFLTFSILKLLYSFFISSDFAHGSNYADQLIDAFLFGRTYWFAYCLLCMYMIAPIFWKDLEKRVPYCSIIFLCLFVLLNSIVHFKDSTKTVFQFGTFIWNMPFFICGLLIQSFKANFKNTTLTVFHLFFIMIGVGIFSLMLYKFLGNIYFARLLFSLSLIIFVYIICRLVNEQISRKMIFLVLCSQYSLQIMFLDSFFKVILYILVMRFLVPSVFVAIVISLIDILLSIICCILLKRLNKIKFIFGL